MIEEGWRVLVCGGRDYADGDAVRKTLSNMHRKSPISLVIHGAAKGADTLAGLWAEKNQVSVARFRAEWDAFGRAAGAIRNQRMLDEGQPDMVVAFPGGRGTADMVRRSKAASLHVIEISEEPLS